jgi:hypothetical protein
MLFIGKAGQELHFPGDKHCLYKFCFCVIMVIARQQKRPVRFIGSNIIPSGLGVEPVILNFL